jgi:plasmid maintenance system antidote protein VapI
MSKPAPITDLLRQAILDALDAGNSFKALERETGVLRQNLMKFVRGEQSMRLNLADRLAAHFGLSLQPNRQPTRKGR